MPNYRVISGRHFYRGKEYTRGQVFRASEDEVVFIQDKVELVSRTREERENEPPEPETINVSPELNMIHKGRGRYDVINAETGQALNSRPLSKEDAAAFMDEHKG